MAYRGFVSSASSDSSSNSSLKKWWRSSPRDTYTGLYSPATSPYRSPITEYTPDLLGPSRSISPLATRLGSPLLRRRSSSSSSKKRHRDPAYMLDDELVKREELVKSIIDKMGPEIAEMRAKLGIPVDEEGILERARRESDERAQVIHELQRLEAHISGLHSEMDSLHKLITGISSERSRKVARQRVSQLSDEEDRLKARKGVLEDDLKRMDAGLPRLSRSRPRESSNHRASSKDVEELQMQVRVRKMFEEERGAILTEMAKRDLIKLREPVPNAAPAPADGLYGSSLGTALQQSGANYAASYQPPCTHEYGQPSRLPIATANTAARAPSVEYISGTSYPAPAHDHFPQPSTYNQTYVPKESYAANVANSEPQVTVLYDDEIAAPPVNNITSSYYVPARPRSRSSSSSRKSCRGYQSSYYSSMLQSQVSTAPTSYASWPPTIPNSAQHATLPAPSYPCAQTSSWPATASPPPRYHYAQPGRYGTDPIIINARPSKAPATVRERLVVERKPKTKEKKKKKDAPMIAIRKIERRR